jgi:uncharacterized protein YhaN
LLEQIESVEEELAQLDHELPMAEGSVTIRLQHAERHLAELERLLPVESKRREAAQEISAAERRLQLAQEKHATATGNWKAKLRALGLPDNVSPDNLETMAGQCEKIAELETRIENRRDDMARRQREFDNLSKRIVGLAEETGLRMENVHPLKQLDHLLREHQQQKQRVTHREGLRERAGQLKAEEAKHAQAALGQRRHREALFEKCGVDDEQALRQLTTRIEEAGGLRKKRAEATREIAAAIGKHGGEQDFAPLLAPETIGRLEADWESLSTQLEQLDRQLKALLQQRGAMIEQQRAQASDRGLANKQIELDQVEEKIKQSAAAWRERATVSVILDGIREDYEQHRQPETLREASNYLEQITGGKYRRIWTPLANDILFVDSANGESLPVQVLSRGTREQLFVCLRLALVAAFARRGIHLPMILDDVFVNFDARRTKIAVTVLRDFAKQGHQLLFFSCHEHIWQLFRELKVDTRRLPGRSEEAGEAAEPEPAPEPIAVLPPPVIEEPIAPPEPEPIPKEVLEEPSEILDEEDTCLDDPEPPVAEVVEYVVPKPVPVAAATEVEYWWHEPQPTNGRSVRDHDDRGIDDWLREPVIYPERW